MSVTASVCICTFNGAARIADVLFALTQQALPATEWEVLVVDNASTDSTREVANRLICETFPERGRVVHEPQPGLSYARARAAKEAEGEIICFLDDDNIPAPNFVQAAIRAFVQFPRAGVIGSKVLPRWEVNPTPLAEAVAPFALAICDLGDQPQRIDGKGGGLVGAGLCVRAHVLRHVFGSSKLAAMVTDRMGTNLISGGDLVISAIAKLHNWECWYVPTLQIEHVLPASRMQKDYLLRLYEGIGRGQAALRQCYDWKTRCPLSWLVGVKDLGRYHIGGLLGPSEMLRSQRPTIAQDLHDLQQSLILGRARQALSWRP